MSKFDYTRRHFLKTIGLGAAAFAIQDSKSVTTLLANEATDRKPNFVFILVDDLGWIDTGCYGSEFYETPNIDHFS